MEELLAPGSDTEEILAYSAVFVYLENVQEQSRLQRQQEDRWSPWLDAGDGFQITPCTAGVLFENEGHR